MAEQYWIGGFYIDLSRNQITQNNQTQTLAPKALAVLTYLAEHQGKVVSQDALLTNVWPDTIVSPNTLQRSIAQLRKALGDDGKGQAYIKTHAKKGYSLECDVRWLTHQESPVETLIGQEHRVSSEEGSADAARSTGRGKPWLPAVAIVAFVAVLGVIGVNAFAPESHPRFTVSEMRSLTTTDNTELGGIYSPDGEYIVFLRYSEETCLNNVWAQHIDTHEEVQLTKDLSLYGRLSFSPDGEKLVFVKEGGCEQPVNQKLCYELMTLDFIESLTSPREPEVLMECKNSVIQRPAWLNNNNIALMHSQSDRSRLISYSIADDASEVIYEIEGGNLLNYDYSKAEDMFAVSSIHADGGYYIDMLASDGRVVSSHPIEYPQEIARFRYVYPNFSPLAEQLIFSTGLQLFSLSREGKVTNISVPLDEPMGTPIFHPDGNRMLVIKGHYDSDIVNVPLSRFAETSGNASETDSVVETNREDVLLRTTLSEDSAMFQPGGDLIAFMSERSGDEQVWVTADRGARQLTNFAKDTYIRGIDWASDGQSILVNASNELVQVGLDGSARTYALPHRVEQLFFWDSQNQSALALISINGIRKFVELDLAQAGSRTIVDRDVTWAARSERGQLVYTDHMDRFWRSGPAEDQLIEGLAGQGNSKGFVVREEVVYGINDDNRLWAYSLTDDRLEILGKLPGTIDNITDISDAHLLMAVRITGRKEVAELTLAE